MRSFVLASAIVGLVSAAPAPAPQDIDFDLAYALPNPTYSVDTGVTSQIVTYDPSTVYSAALSQITASNSETALDTATTTPDAALQKRTACQPQPTGYGAIPSPDAASAFASYSPFAATASAAPTPSGYTLTFQNANASNNAYGYMGYTTLKTYDVNACAAKCNAINGCISFNIYFERDPTVDPGSGNSGCANPASTTNIKCAFWGGPVNIGNALNYGQWRNQFQVVIAGSNGYTNNSVAAVPGYNTAVPLGNAAINAPYDNLGANTFLGSAIFVGAFNAELCADACTQKSNYAVAHPPTDGSPVQTCQFFNTYILYINTTNNIQGQYCAMYSESWAPSYATNVGQYRGNDHFLLEYSFTYTNSSNPGKPNPVAAAYSAKQDILWPGNSALPYCSSLISATDATTTITSTVTTNIAPTATVVDVVATTTVYTSSPDVPGRRAIIAEPQVLTKYPTSIVASGCSLAITQTTSTSTVYTTATISSPTITVVATSTSTETDAAAPTN